MFHIVFNIDENYIKYLAVLITSIIKNTDTTKNLYDISKNNTTGGGGGILIKFSKGSYNIR